MGKTEHSTFNNFLLGMFLLLVDYVVVVCAEQAAFVLRTCLMGVDNLHISWLNFWVVFPILYLAFMNIGQLYSRRMPFYKEVERVFYACCYGTAAIVFVLYVAQIADNTSRLFTALFGVFTFIFLTVIRYAVKKFLIRHQLLQIPVLLIGAGKTAELLVKAITDDPGMGYRIVGLLEDNFVQQGVLERYPLLGTFAEAEEVIQQTGVKHVFIAAPGMPAENLGWLIFKVQQLVEHVVIIPNLTGAALSNVTAESVFYEKLILLRVKNCLADKGNIFIKTVFDYTLTFLGTIVISPLLLLLALKIRLDSPGPIIYDGERLGINGRLFRCYKFRSMYVNGDEILQQYFAEHPEMYAEWKTYHKLEHDPRVTKFGAFLRRTSLDELPQIFNVLLGDMSLVGPRPYLPDEKADMGGLGKTVLSAKPGITGYWQTSGRSDVSFDERVKMDCWYICNWNLWLDMVMLFKTFAVVICRKGAY